MTYNEWITDWMDTKEAWIELAEKIQNTYSQAMWHHKVSKEFPDRLYKNFDTKEEVF